MGRSKLLEDVRDAIRLRHYSYRTEKSYVYWIRKFILFNQKRHPAEMGQDEIRNFLTFLARQKKPALARLHVDHKLGELPRVGDDHGIMLNNKAELILHNMHA